MTNQDIITKMRSLRDAYGTYGASEDELEEDLKAIVGLPKAAVAVAISTYKNANRDDLGLSTNVLTRIALNTVSGAAKRGAFSPEPPLAPAVPTRRSFSF